MTEKNPILLLAGITIGIPIVLLVVAVLHNPSVSPRILTSMLIGAVVGTILVGLTFLAARRIRPD